MANPGRDIVNFIADDVFKSERQKEIEIIYRILLIIGAGHVYLLKRFAIESGFFKIENVLKYL